jgi:hypothetical protein
MPLRHLVTTEEPFSAVTVLVLLYDLRNPQILIIARDYIQCLRPRSIPERQIRILSSQHNFKTLEVSREKLTCQSDQVAPVTTNKVMT